MDKKLALVIDDGKNISLTFSETLAQIGFDTLTASNCEWALTKLQDDQPQVVVEAPFAILPD